jgi:hypothetical protein
MKLVVNMALGNFGGKLLTEQYGLKGTVYPTIILMMGPGNIPHVTIVKAIKPST